MNGEQIDNNNVFFFSSESVGEGHPGKNFLFHSIKVSDEQTELSYVLNYVMQNLYSCEIVRRYLF